MAGRTIMVTAVQNAGIGLVPLLPGADLPVMTLNQAKMVLQIAAAYGQSMGKDRIKEIGACVGGAFLCRTLARELVSLVPILGWLIKPSIAYGGTAALGYAIIEYFEGGEDVTGIANVVERATEKGTELAGKARAIAADPSSINISNIAGKVTGYVPVVREAAAKYVPIAADLVADAAKSVSGAASNWSAAASSR